MLKLNKIKTGKIGTFDIEADHWTDFKIGGIYDRSKYITFTNRFKFIEYMLQPKYKNYRWYAHFGGRYDFHFLLDYLFKHKDKYFVQIRFQASRMLSVIVTDKKSFNSERKIYDYNWYFFDSFSLLPKSLNALTKDFDVRHQKGKWDFTKKIQLTPKFLKYLRHDVLGLYEIIIKFCENISNFDTTLKSTIASQAQDVFYNNFNKGLLHGSRRFELIERKSYYGGRTEIIKKFFDGKDKEKLYYFDINSLYPAIMKDIKIPYGTPYKIKNPCVKDIFKYEGIAYARVENYNFIPLLPKKHEHKLIFPIGSYYGYFCLPELRKAYEMGYKIKIKKLWNYDIREFIFKDYINHFYKIKQKSKNGTPMYAISKLFMNSLYGKFAQRREAEVYKIDPQEKIGLMLYNKEFNIWKEETINNSEKIIPIISSYITSYSRLKLFDYIEKCGNNNIWYMDTDSIITKKKLKTSKRIGKMKLESEIKKAFFLQPKAYSLVHTNNKEENKIKGFDRKNFIDIDNKPIDFNAFENVFNFKKPIKQKFTKMLGIKSSLKRYGEALTTDNYSKTFDGVYTKRITIEDKINTIPIMVKGDKEIKYNYKNPNYKFDRCF